MEVSIGVLLAIGLVALVIGAVAGYFFKSGDVRKKMLEFEADNEKKIRAAEGKVYEAERKAKDIEITAERESKDMIADAKHQVAEMEKESERQRARLEKDEEDLTKKVAEVETQREQLTEKEGAIEAKQEKIKAVLAEQTEVLQKVAKMNKEDAEAKLLKNIEQQKADDLLRRTKALDADIDENLESKAKKALGEAIQRYASEVTNDATQTIVELAADEMKGRIIGREGRNINALERATGVDIIIDDTPGVVILAGYDLLRRFVAKRSLEKLVEDGRIHPARIEEIVTKETEEVDKMIKKFGEKAAEEVGITNLPPEIIKVLGRLRFRTSHGQNVLQHSVEVAFLAEELANQIGADPERAKLAGLLHDIGKSISHEVGGRHAIIGAEICRKFKMDDLVVNAVEAHHEDVEKESIEAFLVQAADAISASRPGARRDSTEQFIKRMKQQEEIVTGFDGVKKTYIMSAGRESWVFVDPQDVSDLEAKKMADNIARKLEEELTYPGQIRVMVIRESRAQAIAK